MTLTKHYEAVEESYQPFKIYRFKTGGGDNEGEQPEWSLKVLRANGEGRREANHSFDTEASLRRQFG